MWQAYRLSGPKQPSVLSLDPHREVIPIAAFINISLWWSLNWMRNGDIDGVILLYATSAPRQEGKRQQQKTGIYVLSFTVFHNYVHIMTRVICGATQTRPSGRRASRRLVTRLSHIVMDDVLLLEAAIFRDAAMFSP
jgi:hypothetical protein